MKTAEQYFPVALFMLFKVVLTFESVNELSFRLLVLFFRLKEVGNSSSAFKKISAYLTVLIYCIFSCLLPGMFYLVEAWTCMKDTEKSKQTLGNQINKQKITSQLLY